MFELGRQPCKFFFTESSCCINLFCTYMHAAITIDQIFPEDNYSCHSPNFMLKCNFPMDPITAFWTVSDDKNSATVNQSTPGHTVDSSKMQRGMIYLEMNKRYSKNNSYSCTAVYADGSTAYSDLFSIPMAEGL